MKAMQLAILILYAFTTFIINCMESDDIKLKTSSYHAELQKTILSIRAANIALSGDGKLIAISEQLSPRLSLGSRNAYIFSTDPKTPEQISSIQLEHVGALKFSPSDDTKLLIMNSQQPSLTSWNVQTGELINTHALPINIAPFPSPTTIFDELNWGINGLHEPSGTLLAYDTVGTYTIIPSTILSPFVYNSDGSQVAYTKLDDPTHNVGHSISLINLPNLTEERTLAFPQGSYQPDNFLDWDPNDQWIAYFDIELSHVYVWNLKLDNNAPTYTIPAEYPMLKFTNMYDLLLIESKLKTISLETGKSLPNVFKSDPVIKSNNIASRNNLIALGTENNGKYLAAIYKLTKHENPKPNSDN